MQGFSILKGRDLAFLICGVLLGSTGLVIAQTSVMEVVENLEVGSDLGVDGNLDVGGDIAVVGNQDVDGDLEVFGELGVGPVATSLTVDSQGDVGVGITSAIEDLTVGGNKAVIAIKDLGTSPPSDTSGYAKLYVDGGEMYVLDDADNETQLSSHADPRDYGEPQGSSFADPNIELPFSFHHKNRILGKGAVVDMAAVVRDLQVLTGKSYTTLYDLPGSSTSEVLERYEWIEIPFEEATEEAEVMLPETRTVFDYNPETGETFQVEEPTGEPSQVGTGTFERRLKENVRFDEETGTFLRRPALADIPQGATPDLPAWIVDRLPQSE